jgi:hypothetical protein
MPQPTLFRFLLLAALAVTAGFLALAIAVPIEPQVPAPLIALFSPGLKLAELIMPETHRSMHGHRRQHRFLLRDLRPDCVPCGSPSVQIARALGDYRGAGVAVPLLEI